VYVSDRPGKHDFDLLKRVVLPDGSVLLCAQPGRPTADCLFSDVMRDGKSLLKVMPQIRPYIIEREQTRLIT
jgi:raffinose synthase